MIDVIIVDDEPAGRRTLRELCEAEADLTVVGEYGDAGAALVGIRRLQPQLLFLDIRMEPLNGLELARSLDSRAPPSLVFVTAYDQYALEAFDVCAVDYLLKPFDRRRFQRTLERVRPRHATKEPSDVPATPAAARDRLADLLALLERGAREPQASQPRLLAELGGRLHVLDVTRVEMIEADRNYIALRVGPDTYYARSTLGQAEHALSGEPMLRISRSCLVNVDYLREVNRTLRGDFILVLAGGAIVTSSEGFRAKVKEYLSTLRLCPP